MLQKAAAETNRGARYGQWAFIPVTDAVLIQQRPSAQLLAGRVNGESVLTSVSLPPPLSSAFVPRPEDEPGADTKAQNNADEGFYFVPQNITTTAAFTAFVQSTYPALTPADMDSILALYAINTTTTTNTTDFATSGLAPPYATSMSPTAAGWQQAANNLYGETTFVCPSYWLATAYRPPAPAPLQSLTGLVPRTSPSPSPSGKTAWRYQFSVPPALHGADMGPLEADPATAGATGPMDAAFRRAMQSVWGGFVVAGLPGLGPAMMMAAPEGGNGSAAPGGGWAQWGAGGGSAMLNMNVTDDGPGPAVADWPVVDGAAWEGGRAARCALWAGLGAVIQQ